MARWMCLVVAARTGRAGTAAGQLPPQKAAQTFTVSPDSTTNSGRPSRCWSTRPPWISTPGSGLGLRFGQLSQPPAELQEAHALEGDRIVILEDSKGTGVADRATTFYQHPDIMAPLGIAILKDATGPGWKVFLAQSPDILVLEDKDGDGKADGPPKKLLTGFRGIDHDHGVHGLLIGPDRKLYFSVGDSGVGDLQSSDGKGRKWTSNSTDVRAGTIWRCDLDGKNLQLVAHNFRNEYEPCVDSFGTVFVSDNDDDGNQQTRICHVMPGGNYGYHPRGRGETHWHEEQPGVVHKILRTFFGSPTGMCVYEGKLLPAKYQGQLLHTDAGPRHVRAYHLKREGASYAVEREDIVQSTDNWFRPSDVCVAPDGSVFVSDWYDPGVGGHGMGDIKMGRIYRLAPKGSAYTVPKVDLTSNNGILAALGSPALSVRYLAMAKLDAMKRQDALALLEPAAVQKEDSILRARALWQLARLGADRSSPALVALFNDTDPRFLELAVRIAKDYFGYDGAALGTYLVGLQRRANLSTSVLREGLLALREQDPAQVKEPLYKLMAAYDGKDRFYLSAIGIAVGTDPKRRAALLSDFTSHFPDWNEKVAGLVWELRPPGVLPLLQKRLADGTIPDADRASLVDVLAGSEDRQAGEGVLTLLKDATPRVRERVLANLQLYLPTKWSHLRESKTLVEGIDGLLQSPETRTAGLELIPAVGRSDLADRILKYTAAGEKDEIRKAAMTALARMPSRANLTALKSLTGEKNETIATAAVAALGEMGRLVDPKSPEAREAVSALETFLRNKTARRDAAVVALTASRPGSERLLALHAENKLPEEVVPLTGRILRNSPFQPVQNKARSLFPAPGKLDPRKLPPISVLAARRGDPAKGQRLLAASANSNLQCLKCHTLRGTGGQVGPDLSMIGKKASRENLIESILNPSKAIADQYILWVVETTKGVSLQGLLVEETPEFIVIRDAEGRDTRIPKKEIETRSKSPKSIMPEDLVAHLAEEDVLDLVEYMLTMKTASLGIDRWYIAGPFDNGNGMEGLDRIFAPEKARFDPKATFDGKHGKVTWRTVKPNATGYVDLAAFHGGQAEQSVSYLTAEIESPVDQEATALLGSDDGAKLWLNGELVHTQPITRAAAPEQDTVRVKLKKGTNRILFKINNGNSPHGLYFTLLSEQELKRK
ncbi:MAG: PVC-type heme-binding CxxCH protein [Gemmataceae bacterium]